MERDEYSSRLKFEHELINRRVTWLLTSQSILFAAYGVALKPPRALFFLQVVALTGATTAIIILVGILTSYIAKYYTWQDFRNSGNANEPFWVRTRLTYIGAIPECAMPILLTFAWVILFVKAGA